MNVKRRHRGLGVKQLDQRNRTEFEILMFLYDKKIGSNKIDRREFVVLKNDERPIKRKERKEKPKTISELEGEKTTRIIETPRLFSIRELSRILNFHTTTITKAINRLRNIGQLIEIRGPHNSRKFCPVDSESGHWLYKHHSQYHEIWWKHNSKQIRENVRKSIDGKELKFIEPIQELIYKKYRQRK